MKKKASEFQVSRISAKDQNIQTMRITNQQKTSKSNPANPQKAMLLPAVRQAIYGPEPAADTFPPLLDIMKTFQQCIVCNAKQEQICDHILDTTSAHARLVVTKYFDDKAGGFTQNDVPTALFSKSYPLPNILDKAFVSVDMPYDNNCGYHALSYSLTLTTYFSKFIKRALYLFARENDDILTKISGGDNVAENEFKSLLLREGTWLNVWGLILASKCFSRTIIVYQTSSSTGRVNGTTFQPSIDLHPGNPVYLYCKLDGPSSHFVALIRRRHNVLVPEANFVPGEMHDKLKGKDLLNYMYNMRKLNNVQKHQNEIEFVDITEDEFTIRDRSMKTASNTKNLTLHQIYGIIDDKLTKEDDEPWNFCFSNSTSASEACVKEEADSSNAGLEQKLDKSLAKTYTDEYLPIEDRKLNSTENLVPMQQKPLYQDQSKDMFLEISTEFAKEIKQITISATAKFRIFQIVNCFKPWLDSIKPRALKRKQKITAVKNLANKVFKMQRAAAGRQILITSLKKAECDQGLINSYINECAKRWGEKSLFDNQNGLIDTGVDRKEIMENKTNNEADTTRPIDKDVTIPKETLLSTMPIQRSEISNDLEIFKELVQEKVNICNEKIEENCRNEDTAEIMPDKEIPTCSNPESSANEGTMEDDKYSDTEKEPELSDNGLLEPVPGDLNVELETLCNIFQVTKSDFKYQPAMKFVIYLDPVLTAKAFSYKKRRFVPHGGWPTVVNRAFPESQRTCSFSADHGVHSYEAKNFFCKMYGHCGGDCGVTFVLTLPKAPEPGIPTKVVVESKGAFVLLQAKQTGRQLRNIDRDEVKKQLEKTKAKAILLKNLNHITGLHALHRNHAQVSEGSLRQIKLESEKSVLLHDKPENDILLLKKEFEEKLKFSKTIRGFLQLINTTPGYLKLVMFDERALRFHIDQTNRGVTKCYLDASGEFVSKVTDIGVKESKEPYVYVLMGENHTKTSYPIAEMVSERGRREDIQGFLIEVRRGLTCIRKDRLHAFGNICVIDWSYAMIGGAMQGINDMEIEDYLNLSWKVLNGEKFWKPRKTCIFICTNHLMKAAQRLFGSKIEVSGKRKAAIISMGLEAIARLQECFTLGELKRIIRLIVRTFGCKYLLENTLNKCREELMSRKDRVEEDSNNDVKEDFNYSEDQKTLRGKSIYYQLFVEIQIEETEEMKKEIADDDNPYYCPQIIDALRDHKIPLWPLWAAALPRISGLKEFYRASNATVESNFNIRKNIFMRSKRLKYNKYAREAFKFHDARIKEAQDKMLACSRKRKKPEPMREDTEQQVEETDEVWGSGKASRRQSTYLTPLVSTHLSPSGTKSQQRLRCSTVLQNRNAKRPKPDQLLMTSPMTQRQTESKTANSVCETLNELPLPRTAKIRTRKWKKLSIPRGIINVGLSCFMNSPLQCLLTLPGLINAPVPDCLETYVEILYRQDLDFPKLHSNANFGKTNLNLWFIQQSKAEEDIIKKRSGSTILDSDIQQNDLPTQEDAHDFLTRLLDLWDLQEIKFLFHFQMQTTLMCSICQKSRVLPNEDCFELSVDPNISIKQAIHKSSLDKSNVDCRCGIGNCTGQEMVSSSIVSSSPKYLRIRSEIFSSNSPWEKMKIPSNIPQFSETVNLPTATGSIKYSLHGLVVHTGPSRHEGHYITFLKLKDSWLRYSDDICETKAFVSMHGTEAVYLSFYVKV